MKILTKLFIMPIIITTVIIISVQIAKIIQKYCDDLVLAYKTIESTDINYQYNLIDYAINICAENPLGISISINALLILLIIKILRKIFSVSYGGAKALLSKLFSSH